MRTLDFEYKENLSVNEQDQTSIGISTIRGVRSVRRLCIDINNIKMRILHRALIWDEDFKNASKEIIKNDNVTMITVPLFERNTNFKKHPRIIKRS